MAKRSQTASLPSAGSRISSVTNMTCPVRATFSSEVRRWSLDWASAMRKDWSHFSGVGRPWSMSTQYCRYRASKPCARAFRSEMPLSPRCGLSGRSDTIEMPLLPGTEHHLVTMVREDGAQIHADLLRPRRYVGETFLAFLMQVSHDWTATMPSTLPAIPDGHNRNSRARGSPPLTPEHSCLSTPP